MLLTLVTTTGTLYDRQEIAGLYAETSAGPMLMLDHHASLIASMPLGHLRIISPESSSTLLLRGAVIEIDNPTNHATIRALTSDEVSATAELNLRNYLTQLQAVLAQPNIDTESFKYRFLHNEKIVLERQLKSSPKVSDS